MTAGHDGDVTVRDAVTATPVRSFSVSRSRRPGPLPRGLEPPEVWAVVVALSSDGSRAAAVTIEGTVYVWDVASGKQLFDHADAEAGGPPLGSLRFESDGALLAPMADRYGMRHIDLSRKASRALTSAPKAYHTVAITDTATAFAVVTSSAAGGWLDYAVEVWRLAPAVALVPRRDDLRTVRRDEHSVDATRRLSRVHANLPALGAGGHLTGDQPAVDVADDHEAAVRAQRDRVHHGHETRNLEHPERGHRRRPFRRAGRQEQREREENATHRRDSSG
jgi:hypothetical protein